MRLADISLRPGSEASRCWCLWRSGSTLIPAVPQPFQEIVSTKLCEKFSKQVRTLSHHFPGNLQVLMQKTLHISSAVQIQGRRKLARETGAPLLSHWQGKCHTANFARQDRSLLRRNFRLNKTFLLLWLGHGGIGISAHLDNTTLHLSSMHKRERPPSAQSGHSTGTVAYLCDCIMPVLGGVEALAYLRHVYNWTALEEQMREPKLRV